MGQTCSKSCKRSETAKRKRKKKRPKTAELTNESDQTELRWYKQILVDEDVVGEDEELPSHEEEMMNASKINVISDTKSAASVRSALKGPSSNYSPGTSMNLDCIDNGSSSSPRWAVSTRPVDHSSNFSNQSNPKMQQPPRTSSVSIGSSAGGMTTTTSGGESHNLPTYYPTGHGGPSDMNSERSDLGLTPQASSGNLRFTSANMTSSGSGNSGVLNPSNPLPADTMTFVEPVESSTHGTGGVSNVTPPPPVENVSMASTGIPNSSTTTGPGSSMTTIKEGSPAMAPSNPTGINYLPMTLGLNASQTSSQGAMGLSSVQIPQALGGSITSTGNQVPQASPSGLGVLSAPSASTVIVTRQTSPCPAPDMNSMFVPFGGAASPEPNSGGGIGNASMSGQNISMAGYSSSNAAPYNPSISGSTAPTAPLQRPPAHLSHSLSQTYLQDHVTTAAIEGTIPSDSSSAPESGQCTPGGVVTTSPHTTALVPHLRADLHHPSDGPNRQLQSDGVKSEVPDASLEIAAEIHMPQPHSRQHSNIASHNDSPRAGVIPHWDPPENSRQYTVFAPPSFTPMNNPETVGASVSDRASASSQSSSSSRGVNNFNVRSRQKSVSFDCNV